MSTFMLYLWTRLDILFGICVAVIAIAGSCGVIFGVGCAANREYAMDYGSEPATTKANWYKNICKKSLLSVVLALSTILLVPNKRDLAIIYVVPKIIQSETMQTISKETPEITRLGLEALKGYLEEIVKGENNGQKNRTS